MPTGNKVTETRILDNSIDISNNLNEFKIKNNTTNFIIVDQSGNSVTINADFFINGNFNLSQLQITMPDLSNGVLFKDSSNEFIRVDAFNNKIFMAPQVEFNLKDLNDAFVIKDSSNIYFTVDSSNSLLKLGPQIEFNLGDLSDAFIVKDISYNYIIVDSSNSIVKLGPQVELNLSDLSDAFIVKDISYNYIIVDSSLNNLKLGNLSEINFDSSLNTIDIKINNSRIQQDFYITGFKDNFAVSQYNNLMTINSFFNDPSCNALLQLKGVLKAVKKNGPFEKFSIITESSYAFNYLQNHNSIENLNLFGQTGATITHGRFNYDVSQNVFYVNMDLSGSPLNHQWDISFNLIVNNLYI